MRWRTGRRSGNIEDRRGESLGYGGGIQWQTQGRIIPAAFTHGSSEQRVRWFRRGLESVELSACDTFAAASL